MGVFVGDNVGVNVSIGDNVGYPVGFTDGAFVGSPVITVGDIEGVFVGV